MIPIDFTINMPGKQEASAILTNCANDLINCRLLFAFSTVTRSAGGQGGCSVPMIVLGAVRMLVCFHFHHVVARRVERRYRQLRHISVPLITEW